MRKFKIFTAVLAVAGLFFLASCSKQTKAEVSYKPGTYEASAKGNNGEITVKTVFSATAITDVTVIAHKETGGISDPALNRIPKAIVEQQSLAIDTVSGATYTSRAILAAVEQCAVQAGADVALLKTAVTSKGSTSVKNLSADVVVAGGGGAGLSAALAAAENGKKVILLEKVSSLGGATRLSGGLIPAVGTAQQVQAGIADNIEWFVRDMMRPSNYSVREDLVYTVAENAKGTIEWLEKHGVKFSVVTSSLYYGQSNYRMHLAEGSGAGLTKILVDAVTANKNITVLMETPASGILTDKKGLVTGLSAKGNDGTRYEIKANNVILATSGFGANTQMVKKYMPEIAAAYPYVAPGATGEGILWGEQLGAAVANMGAYQGHAFYSEQLGASVDQGLANNGGIFVNQNGVRFTSEYNGYSELSPHVLAQPGNYAYLVFTDAIAKKSARFQTFVDKGIVISAKTAEELAEKLNIQTAAFSKTINSYKESIKKGEDEFNRTKLPDAFDSSYHAIKITADLRHTQGGLVTDIATHVLRENGTVIQGLYAAGGVMEGFSSEGGAAYMSGNGLLQAIIFGKIAGEKASTETKGSVEPVIWQKK